MGSQPPIEVVPLGGAIDATWTVPGSKSMTNRGLVLAALSEGTTELQGVLHSDDTRHMARHVTACDQRGSYQLLDTSVTRDHDTSVTRDLSRLSESSVDTTGESEPLISI